jgi:hypothetical protein
VEDVVVPILHWSATASPGGLSCSGTSDATCTIVGLTNGVTYTITVSVTTATGTATDTFVSGDQPLGTPAASAVTATAVGTAPALYSVTFNWSQPANGGSAITSYHITSTNTATLVQTSYLVASARYASNVNGGAPDTEVGALAFLEANAELDCIVPSGDVSGGVDSTDASNQAIPSSTTCTIYLIGAGASPTYTYTISATNGIGTTTSPVSAALKLAAAGTVPSAPYNFTATPVTTTSVSLAWHAPANTGGSAILGYDVFEGTAAGKESTTPVNGVTLIAASPVTVPGLVLGTTYYFTVVAVNANGMSAPAFNTTFTAQEISYDAIGSPGVPTGLGATSPTGTSVNLTWTAPASTGGAAVTGYLIYAGIASGGEANTPINTALVTGTTYTATGLNTGTTYYFVVVADNGAGFSLPSGEANAKTSGSSGTLPVLPTVTGTYFVPTFSTNAPVVVTGTGFTNAMTVASSNAAYTVKLEGIGGIDASGNGTTATLLVTTTSAATSGTSSAVTFTNPDGGAVSFTLNGGPAVTPPPSTKPVASGVSGKAAPGKTSKVVVSGKHFYGSPKVTSTSPGTTVRVATDHGTSLGLWVKTPIGTHAGVKVFTIRFAHGQVIRVRYSVS